MNKFWKSFGWFWLSVLPMVICLVLQVVMMALVMGLAALVMIIRLSGTGILDNPDTLFQLVSRDMMQWSGLGLMVFHVFNAGLFGLWYYLLVHKDKQQRRRNRPPGVTVPKAVNGRLVGMTVVLGCGLCWFTNQLVAVWHYLFPQVIEDFYKLLEQAGLGLSLLSVITTVILAPIGEELLCRGVIQYYAGKISRRFWAANLIQALMFGIMHANWVQGVYAFFIGLVIGWVRHRYDSLLLAMLLHFINNFLSSFVMAGLLGLVPDSLTADSVMFVLSIGVMAGCLFVMEKLRPRPVCS